MTTFKTKQFAKWASKNEVDDTLLLQAAREISEGNFEANYGGGVIKKRIANKGRGKSGSARVITVFKLGNHCFFVYGFEKSEKSTISENEEKAFKLAAKSLLTFSHAEIEQKVSEGVLIEVINAKK